MSALPLLLWNILVFTNYGDLKYIEIDEETSRGFGYWHAALVFFFVAAEFAYFDYVTHKYSQALRKSLAAEEQASRAKSAFLASINHEIRTPLNAILGGSDLLHAHPQATPDIRRLADYIDRAGQDILSMTEKCLTYTTLISAPIEVTLRPEAPMALVRAELAPFDAVLRSKGITVETRQDCSDLVMADASLLSKVLGQLIDNAGKYLPEKGTIRLIVANGADDKLRISVEDNGPGIPAEKHEQVFQPFERLDQSLGTKSGGGIGLTIARTYVEAMGGDIGIASAPGGGTHVWVELPRAPGGKT
nr:HAMP domain-containing sensor histidine kinase [Thalassovita aquimarina]